MDAKKWLAALSAVAALAAAGCAQQPPVMEAVIGNNFGHLPMFVGVEKGLFQKHGVDLKLKVVNTGTDMVNSMHKNEVQFGDMSVTTFLKARHAGLRRPAARDRRAQGLGDRES